LPDFGQTAEDAKSELAIYCLVLMRVLRWKAELNGA
jgi:hypothetical protein